MRESLLRVLACPYCGGGLEVAGVTERREELWEGTLGCRACEASFAVRGGMPFVHRDDGSWVARAREAAGWVEIHKRQGNYEPNAARIDLQIPYYGEEPWRSVARRFDAALAQLQLSGEETLLDLGAGRGWAAKQFARLGCEAVALDVTADENVGLGRGRALMEDAGVYFERVIGDGESLPFQPQSFDVVFCSAALHHAMDLPGLLQSVGRVLKPGGRLCAIREPSLSMMESEAEELAREAGEEAALGINETRPTYMDYMAALEGAGMQPTLVVPAAALGMSDVEVQVWARDLGALWAWPDWRAPRRSVWRLWAYGRKRVRALARRRLGRVNGSAVGGERERALEAVVRWCTGELFLLAERHGGRQTVDGRRQAVDGRRQHEQHKQDVHS